MESLTRHLGTCIFHTIRSIGCPLVVLCVGVVGSDTYHATLSYSFLVPLYLDRGYHCLTGKTKTTWRTMVEDIPLTIYLLNGSVGVVGGIHTNKMRSVLIRNDTT